MTFLCYVCNQSNIKWLKLNFVNAYIIKNQDNIAIKSLLKINYHYYPTTDILKCYSLFNAPAVSDTGGDDDDDAVGNTLVGFVVHVTPDVMRTR